MKKDAHDKPVIDLASMSAPCVSPFIAGVGPPLPLENLTCDVCGYQHPPSNPFVVSMDEDGVIRCARCRTNAIKKGRAR